MAYEYESELEDEFEEELEDESSIEGEGWLRSQTVIQISTQ